MPLVLFARSQGYRDVIVAEENAAVRELNIFSARHLLAVARHMDGSKPLNVTEPSIMVDSTPVPMPDMADIRGQQQARRVLEIAASGAHHLLMTGSPGVGKSMLAQRLPGILPALTMEQALDVTRIYSISGDTSRQPMSRVPPL